MGGTDARPPVAIRMFLAYVNTDLWCCVNVEHVCQESMQQQRGLFHTMQQCGHPATWRLLTLTQSHRWRDTWLRMKGSYALSYE